MNERMNTRAWGETLAMVQDEMSRELVSFARDMQKGNMPEGDESEIAAIGMLLLAAGRMLGRRYASELDDPSRQRLADMTTEKLNLTAIIMSAGAFCDMTGPQSMMRAGMQVGIEQRDFADERRGGK